MQEMLNTLARRSFAACRVRNLIAVLAIALCSTLFTSITAIGIGTLQSITLMMQEQKMSRSDGDFRYMSKEQFEMMKGSDLIREAGLRMPVGFLTNARLHNIEFDVMDETQAELTFCMPVHGEVPRRENEVVASDKALRDLGVEPQVGARITVAFTAHGRDYTFPMVVSGWYEALNDQLSVMWTGLPFRDANPDIFRNTYNKDFEMAGTYWSDILAVSRTGLQEKMTELARSMGGDPEDMGSPDYLPAVVNAVTNPVPDPQLLVMGAVFVALFIFCGYLLIYNVFVIYIMNGKLRTSDELQRLFNISQLGLVVKEEGKKKFIVDRWIDALRNRGKRRFTREQSLELAAAAVKISAQKQELNAVCLIGCDLKAGADVVCQALKERLDREKLEVMILDNVLYDAEAMERLGKSQGVVLVEKAMSTMCEEIARELELAQRQGIRVLGGIVVE